MVEIESNICQSMVMLVILLVSKQLVFHAIAHGFGDLCIPSTSTVCGFSNRSSSFVQQNGWDTRNGSGQKPCVALEDTSKDTDSGGPRFVRMFTGTVLPVRFLKQNLVRKKTKKPEQLFSC